MTVKLNGKTILNNVVNKSQTGYAFLDFTTLDIITEFEAASDYFIDDVVYKKLPNTNLLAEKSKLGAYTAISPNPANDQIVVSPDINTQGAWQVRLLNNLGQLISRETGTAESPLVIETSAYKSGMYFIDFQSEGAHWTKKVVIQH